MKLASIILYLLSLTSALGAELSWQNDYDAALVQAATEGKPVLVDFTAGWCTWCRFMEETTFRDHSVQASLDHYLLVRVNYDQATELVAKYAVKGIPALFVLNRFGETVSSQTGYADPRAFYDWIARNDKDAQAKVSIHQGETAKFYRLVSELAQAQPEAQPQLAGPLIEAALANAGESAFPARHLLQSMISKNSTAFLEKLGDPSLAVRILFTSLYAEKLGADFHFDPWEKPELQAAIIQSWKSRLTSSPID